MQAAYTLGRQSHLKLLLNQQQPDQIARMMRYHDYVIEARANKFDEYRQTITRLNEVEPAIKNTVATLSAIRSDLEKKHGLLVDQQKQKELTLVRLRKTIKNKDDELRKLERDQKELEQVIAVVEDLINDLPLPNAYQPFDKLKGKLPWPLKGKVTNRFGATRKGRVKWDGLMITAEEGTDVKAIHHGRVIFANWLRGQGLLMIIDHSDGYMSLYAHNQVLLKEPGEWVQANDIIGRVGNSGGQQQAGLYFEIRYKGKPSNPKRWCKRA